MSTGLVEYIKNNGLQCLADEFAINIKRHKKYNNLVLLKYDQLNSPLGNSVVQQCRGIILDENDDWRIISWSYDKFFNYGEGHAAEIDWNTARVYEKLDGSLMTVYFYDNNWHVASSGLPDASGEVMGTNTTFAELFWKTWRDLGYQLPTDTSKCFSFELMTPYNRIVVRHEKSRIVLHGARRLSDLRELNPIVEAHTNGWECVKIFPLHSWDNILSAAKNLDPMKTEGYVVCDGNYNRVKVKSPAYVAVSRLKDSTSSSSRQLLDKIRINDHEEFLSYFPEMKDVYYRIKVKYEKMLSYVEGFYEAISDIDDRKAFAMMATRQKFSGALFAIKFGKSKSFAHYFSEMNIKTLEDWLEIKNLDISSMT